MRCMLVVCSTFLSLFVSTGSITVFGVVLFLGLKFIVVGLLLGSCLVFVQLSLVCFCPI